jgi:Protein of unknown function (DUF1579)
MNIDLETEPTRPFEPDAQHQRLLRLCRAWRGTAKTYMDPTHQQPPLEAPWDGRIAPILGGRFVRFTYRTQLEDKPIAGELLIAYESGEKLYRTAWVDSFHTGTAILASQGDDGGGAIEVLGRWFAGEGAGHWGWRTVIDDSAADALVIRMFNISPDGQQDLGVEITLR